MNVRVSYAWGGLRKPLTGSKQNTDQSVILATAYDPTYYLYIPVERLSGQDFIAETRRAVPDNRPLLAYAEQSTQEKVILELLQLYPKTTGVAACEPGFDAQDLCVTSSRRF